VKKKVVKKAGKLNKKHSKAIIILICIIIVLALGLGYDIYTVVKTKSEAQAREFALNEAIYTLNLEKDALIVERNNLLFEIETLEEGMKNLNLQKTILISEKEDLTSDLKKLQTKYDSLAEDYQETKDELDACEATP